MTNVRQNLPTSPVFYSALFFHPAYEVWKPIVGFEGLYEVSNYCRVKSIRSGRLLKAQIGSRNQPTVHLSVNGKTHISTTYRSAAIAFIPNPNNKKTVNHIYGNRLINHVSLLEWATHQEQILHAINSGLMDCIKNLPDTKTPVVLHPASGGKSIDFESLAAAGRYLGCTPTQVSRRCARGNIFKAKAANIYGIKYYLTTPNI